MARNLEQLTKQYGKAAHPGKGGMMPGRRGPGGPGGPRGPRLTGKPKNTAKTIGRMLRYISKYKFRLIGVVFLMLTSTIIGLIVNILFKPRTWCSFCPMGTMTQMICKIKAKEKL